MHGENFCLIFSVFQRETNNTKERSCSLFFLIVNFAFLDNRYNPARFFFELFGSQSFHLLMSSHNWIAFFSTLVLFSFFEAGFLLIWHLKRTNNFTSQCLSQLCKITLINLNGIRSEHLNFLASEGQQHSKTRFRTSQLKKCLRLQISGTRIY